MYLHSGLASKVLVGAGRDFGNVTCTSNVGSGSTLLMHVHWSCNVASTVVFVASDAFNASAGN